MNRSFYFPAFVFLLLFALLLLLSGQLSRFSVPCSTRESGKAIDRAAVEKATLTIPQALTKRDLQPDPPSVFAEFRRRFSIVGLFPHPVKINVLTIDQQVDSSVDAPLNRVIQKLGVAPSYRKDHVHSPFNIKIMSRSRRAASSGSRRSNSQSAGFFLGLAHQVDAFMSRLQTIGIEAQFIQKKSLVTRTNGRQRKEIRINERRIRSRLTSSFRPARSQLLRALARKGREFALAADRL